MAAPADRTVLEAFVEAFVDDAGRSGYADLGRRQRPPFGNLGYGAAGVAYALAQAGDALGEPRWRRLAARWIAPAVAASRRAETLASPDARRPPPRASLFFGLAGLHFADARVATSPERRARAVRRFQAAALDPDDNDLYLGAAGVRIAATRLGLRGQELVAPRAPARLAWGDPRGWLAHGNAGTLLAMVTAGRAPDAGLAALADEYLALLRRSTGPAPFRGSICKGSAGMALLYAAAWERLRRPLYLEVARAAAEDVETSRADGASLCCGAGGGAYALLALARTDGRSWRERAMRRARAAVTMSDPGLRYGGILGGQAGLFCLAADLIGSAKDGFPGLET